MPSFLERLSAATRAFLGRQERSLPPPNIAAYQGWGKAALFKPEESLGAYGDSVWLYRSVLTIAMEVARTKFKLRRPRSDGEFEYVESHQALETLKKPQPTKDGKSMLTSMDLMLVLGMRLMLNGEEFWVLDKRMSGKFGGSPREIQPALPQYMHTILGKTGEIQEYVYRLPEKEVRLPPMDVVHFKLPDPLDLYRGHSPVQSIRYAIDTHKQADQMNTKRLKNNAVPSGTLETEQTPPDEQRKKILDSWRQMYGGPDNAGKVALLPNGFKFTKIQESNQDMQFIEGKKLVREEILANYGVSLEVIGQTDSVTRANAEAAIFVFQRFGVLPYLDKIADTLNNDFLPAFAGTEGLEFCFDDPVPQNMEEKRLNMQTAFGLGAVTPNEVRKEMGLEPLELPGMDTPYLDVGKMAVGIDPLPPDDGPLPDEEDEDPIDDPPKGEADTDEDKSDK